MDCTGLTDVGCPTVRRSTLVRGAGGGFLLSSGGEFVGDDQVATVLTGSVGGAAHHMGGDGRGG
ncbi:hypothetical protein [Micromonospora sp. CPCC 206061]|uniref:hypothetical protein n=1 Tax=Micromonospora sp. CPCC 206061 TaxID=3122410 RepID=UPI003FA53B1C